MDETMKVDPGARTGPIAIASLHASLLFLGLDFFLSSLLTLTSHGMYYVLGACLPA